MKKRYTVQSATKRLVRNGAKLQGSKLTVYHPGVKLLGTVSCLRKHSDLWVIVVP